MILLILIGVFLISISGYMSYALFSTEVTSDNTISLKASNIPKIYHYTGDYQVFTVQKTGYYTIEAYGASANNNYSSYVVSNPSYGGYTKGTILLNEGEKIYIYVGGKGTTFNCCDQQGLSSRADGSGGATDIRYFGNTTPTEEDLEWDSALGLNSRIMVAGGAGATYADSTGGTGGSAGGLMSIATSHDSHSVGRTTQISGGPAGANGTAGIFGKGGTNTNTNYNSGGGGYYGGGSGPSGGGGSSFISGYAGVNAIESLDIEKFENVRYVKDCTNGNTANESNHWLELQAYSNGTNVALGKTVTATAEISSSYSQSLSAIVDGTINSSYYTDLGSGLQCITVDLAAEYDLEKITTYYYYSDGRTYNDHSLYVSSDNSNWTTLIDNEDGAGGTASGTSINLRTHTNNTLHYSGKYFLDAEMKAGFNKGHGKVKITYFGETAPERINEGLNNVRYIKDCINANNLNSGNHWVEFQAIYNGKNIAKDLTVTGITAAGEAVPLSMITNGDITSENYTTAYSGGLQCITIDLGAEYDLEEVAVWHYWSDNRIYNSNVTYTSSDNTNWTEIIKEDAIETSEGKRINAYEEHIGSYSYTGGEQTITVANTGCYGFELWGAQGGPTNDSSWIGGRGGYTYGTKILEEGTQLFINIGGGGSTTSGTSTSISGGYNGGGKGIVNYYNTTWIAGGGGATHIATASGLLKNLSSNKSSVIAVAGGGGGSAWVWNARYGGDGGGYQGDNGNATNYTDSNYNWTCQALGGKQEQTYSNYCGSGHYSIFGQGGDTIPQNSVISNYTYGSGGGGGWYGGGGNFGQSDVPGSGAGGSGYIGGMNTNGSSYMYCYTCSTSNDNKTLTYSTSNSSGYAISKYAKNRNGAARIYYLGKTCPSIE